MDVFQEMPLNQAHLKERMAERLMKCEKWDESIVLYQEAGDYITHAMETISDRVALKSLQYQREHYLSQCKMIELKKYEKKEMDKKERENSIDVEDDNLAIEHGEGLPRPNNTTVLAEAVDVIDGVDSANKEIQPDSLMPFWKDQLKSKLTIPHRKCPKDDMDVIEELTMQNTDLKQFVEALMLSNEHLSKQNEALRNENMSLREDNNNLCAYLNKNGKASSSDELIGNQVSISNNFLSLPSPNSSVNCFNFELSVEDELSSAMAEDFDA